MQDRPSRLTGFGAIALYGWFALLTTGTVFGTFSLVYFSDDLDHLQRAAELRSGQTGVAEFFWRPHNEQTLPVLRAMYWLATLRGGFEATVMRVLVVFTHAAGALACASLIFFSTRSMAAAWFGGSMYAAAGFIANVVWAPSNAIFCLGGVGLAFCFAALASPLRDRRLALALSLAAALFAVAGMNGTGVGLAAVPVFCWLTRVPLPIPIAGTAILFTGLGASALAAARWNTERLGLHSAISAGADTIPAALWFPFSALGRFVLSWWTYDPPGVPGIAAASAICWIVAMASLYFLDRKMRWLLAALWVAPIAIGCLVSIGRAQEMQLGPLYVTDRYYYFFLLPLSVHAALLALPVLRSNRRTVAVALLLALAFAVRGSRLRYLQSTPLDSFAPYEAAFAGARALAARIDRSPRPLVLADGRIPFDGVRHGWLTLRCLIYTLYPGGLDGVGFAAEPLSEEQSAVQNAILDEWARAEGRASLACVSNGRLEQVRPHAWLDFEKAGHQEAIGEGVWHAQGGRRYLGRAGTFHLRTAPGDFVVRATSIVGDLRRRWPHFDLLRVHVEIDGVKIGEMAFDETGDREFPFSAPAIPRDGREVLVVLTADRVWRPNKWSPRNLDSRELSIEVRAIGFPSAAPAPLFRCSGQPSSNVKDQASIGGKVTRQVLP